MIELDGQRLSLAQIAAVASARESVSLSNSARERVTKSRQVVEQIVAEGRTVYGVNTGFGRLSDVRIDKTLLVERTVWMHAGSPRHVVGMSPVQLSRLVRAAPADLVAEV